MIRNVQCKCSKKCKKFKKFKNCTKCQKRVQKPGTCRCCEEKSARKSVPCSEESPAQPGPAGRGRGRDRLIVRKSSKSGCLAGWQPDFASAYQWNMSHAMLKGPWRCRRAGSHFPLLFIGFESPAQPSHNIGEMRISPPAPPPPL